MRLFRIQHDLIADTTPDGWYRVMVDGPSFHYRWQFGTGPNGPFSYVMGEHHQHAVCRAEPSLTMSWGLDVHEHTEMRDLHFAWAEKFIDKVVHPFWVDFFWNNALIDRVVLARVDGSHGVVPLPGYDMEVTDFEVAVAYLVFALEDSRHDAEPGHYLDMIGAKKVRDDAREGAGSGR